MNKKILTIITLCFLLSTSWITYSLATDKVTVGQVTISQQGDYTRILIPISEKVRYKTKKLDDPVRLVIDLLNSNYSGEMQTHDKHLGVLRSVRLNQFKQKPVPVTRIVVELSDSTPFFINKENSNLVINLENKLSDQEMAALDESSSTVAKADTLAKSTNEVYHIEVQSGPKNDKVFIKTKEPASYSLLEMEKNKILVLDIPDARHTVPQSNLSFDGTVVKEIRSSQFQMKPFETVRVAIGLKDMVAYRVEKSDVGITVTLDHPSTKKVEPVTEPAPVTTMAATPSVPQFAEAEESSDEPSLVDSLGILLGKGASMRKAPLQQPAFSPPPRVQARSQYTAQMQSDWEEGLITLDFKDVEITNVLRMLSYKRNLNIIAGNDVSGKVTVRLIRVPWEQALRMILQINGFDFEKRGDIIWVTTKLNLEAEESKRLENAVDSSFINIINADAAYVSEVIKSFISESGSVVVDKRTNTLIVTDTVPNLIKIKGFIKKIDVEKSEEYVPPQQTRIYVLNYANAKEISKTIGSMLSDDGSVQDDVRTNSLIVTESEIQHNMIEGIIAELDTKTPQVMIESKLVDITLSKQKQLGIKWALGNKSQTGFDIPDQPNTDTRITGSISSEVAKTGYLTVGTLLDTAILDAAISAHASDSDINLLANPKIATLDNELATIMIGSKVPILTLDEQGNPKTELVDIGIKLSVTPHITNDGYVTMNVHPEVSKLADSPGTGASIQIDISEVITNIMIKDGQTAVIGGLLRRDITDTKTGIPYLSKIPLLGYLFRGNTKRNDHRELLIFITPHIVRELSSNNNVYKDALDHLGLDELKGFEIPATK